MDNFIDKIVGFVSPKAAFYRSQYKLKNDLIKEGTRRYEAADRGRRTDGWISNGSSASAEIYSSLPTLRNRARDLVRNNNYAAKAINVIVSNTIGTGISMTPKGPARGLKKARDVWDKWANTTDCDYEGMLDFNAIQSLVMRTVAMSGECLVRIRRVGSKGLKTVPIKLQILEGDFISDSHDGSLDNTGQYTISGIKFDKNGKRIGYWLFDRHPGDVVRLSGLTPSLIPADEILHIYKIDRPGQIRGVPFGVSGMLKLRDFDDYEDAQLVRQKIAACFALFVEDSTEALSISNGNTPAPTLPEKVEPGIIEYLQPGKKITFASPPHTEGYAEYTRKMLQGIASGYGVTYEAMTGDLSGVNFSSGRMGWIEMHREISTWQSQMIIPMLCHNVFSEFIRAGVVAGYWPDNDFSATWTPPRREMIDPLKEVAGLRDQVRAGLMSWQEAVRTLGFDPDILAEQLNDDFKLFAKHGLMLTSDPRYDPARKPGLLNDEPGTGIANAPASDSEGK